MTKRLRALLAIAVAFVLLSAGDCEIGDLGNILDKPGKVVVTNTSPTETVAIAITGPDFKSYPTVGPGATVSATTNVGGPYQLTVILSGESLLNYKADLENLKRTVRTLVDSGSVTTEEKVYLFTKLAGINAALAQMQQSGSASCSGNIELDRDNDAIVNSIVSFVTQSGSGFWDITCGSNE